MKKKLLLLCLILALSCSFLTSCLYLPLLDFGTDEDDYMTREEIEQLIDGKLGDGVTVEGGDSYDVNIENSDSPNILAASKGLLSSVSVYCNFEMNYTTGGFGTGTSSSTKEYASAGSGVIYRIDKNKGDAYIITNFHVVYDYRANTENHVSDDISVYLYGQETAGYAIPATYVGGSMNYDLAVLKVENSRVLAESLAVAASFANSNDVAVLETAIAIGNPESGGISATVGYVNVDSEYLSMTASDNATQIELRVMRIDTAVNSGNSGGGLFNDKGELIGIVNAKMADSSVDNIGYAIPSNIVKYVTENILHYCDGTEKESVYRCIIGVKIQAKESSARYDTETGKVHKTETVAVIEVTEGSVADGVIKVGDVINSITINGVKYDVTRMFHVVDSMLNARLGSTVTVNVTRDGQATDLSLTITEAAITEYK